MIKETELRSEISFKALYIKEELGHVYIRLYCFVCLAITDYHNLVDFLNKYFI